MSDEKSKPPTLEEVEKRIERCREQEGSAVAAAVASVTQPSR